MSGALAPPIPASGNKCAVNICKISYARPFILVVDAWF